MLEVSIVIVNWNSRGFLKDCLQSIREGVNGISHEVIIVDNASGDGSSSFVEENFPGVKLIKNSRNTGFATACNQGAASSRGKYLFFLNPDTIIQGDSIKRLIGFVQTQPWLGAVGPRLISRDGRVQNSVRRFPGLMDILLKDTVLKRLLPLVGKDRLVHRLSDRMPSNVDQISGAAFLMKKDLWVNIGGMDQRFFMFYEEVDLCRRLKGLGFGIFYLPTARIIHLGGGSRHKDRSTVFYHSVKSMFLYLQKYESPARLFWFKFIYKPLFLIELLVGINNRAKRDFIKRCLVDFIKF